MMRVLFILSGLTGTRTLFHLAEKMVGGGSEVSFLFVQEGCRCAVNPDVISDLSFAKAIYLMKEDCIELLNDLVDSVEVVDYEGWIRLLELCEKSVSWT